MKKKVISKNRKSFPGFLALALRMAPVWAGLALVGLAPPSFAETKLGKDIEVKEGFVRLAYPEAMAGAAYFVLENRGTQLLNLTGASCGCARSVEIHQTKMDGDVARMQAVSSLPIPPQGRVTLAPKGTHLMLMGMQGGPYKQGQEVTVTLRFEGGREVTVDLPVRSGR